MHSKQILYIFAVLLGVLSTYDSAEITPYEPDMYNDSAGKRYGIHCLQAWIEPSSPGCIMIFDNEDHNILWRYHR